MISVRSRPALLMEQHLSSAYLVTQADARSGWSSPFNPDSIELAHIVPTATPSTLLQYRSLRTRGHHAIRDGHIYSHHVAGKSRTRNAAHGYLCRGLLVGWVVTVSDGLSFRVPYISVLAMWVAGIKNEKATCSCASIRWKVTVYQTPAHDCLALWKIKKRITLLCKSI